MYALMCGYAESKDFLKAVFVNCMHLIVSENWEFFHSSGLISCKIRRIHSYKLCVYLIGFSVLIGDMDSIIIFDSSYYAGRKIRAGFPLSENCRMEACWPFLFFARLYRN